MKRFDSSAAKQRFYSDDLSAPGYKVAQAEREARAILAESEPRDVPSFQGSMAHPANWPAGYRPKNYPERDALADSLAAFIAMEIS